jgi:hypothetical protein
MKNRKKGLLLLTATINPMVEVARANPNVRLNDYLDALKLWWKELESLPVNILFCENSGYDIQIIKDWIISIGAENRVKTFQFDGDKTLVARLGKGAGEAEIYDECFKNGLLAGHDYILKCTGRLFVKNAKLLIEQAILENSDFAISFRSPLDLVDTRFFILKYNLYGSYMLGLAKEVNDRQGRYIEHAVLKRLCRAISEGYIWGQFTNLPRFVGVGGSDGKVHSSILGALRYFVKNSIHQLGVKFGIYWYL